MKIARTLHLAVALLCLLVALSSVTIARTQAAVQVSRIRRVVRLLPSQLPLNSPTLNTVRVEESSQLVKIHTSKPVCDPAADLSGAFVSNSEGRVTNRSPTCSYPIGLASYRRFDAQVSHQVIFDWVTALIGPGESHSLVVRLPDCASQTDLFYGPVLMSLNGQRYGTRNLASRWIGGTTYCQHGTPTPTSGPTATPTPSPTPGGGG